MGNDSKENSKIFYELPVIAHEVLDNVGHSVVLTDADGTILFWNIASEKLFGYKKNEVLGENILMLNPEYGEVPFMKEVRKLEPGNVLSWQWQSRHKDGSRVWISTKTNVILNGDGEPLVVIGSSSSIDKRKELECDLEESQARAEAILNNTVDAIITINRAGIIQSFNRAAEKMFGYTEQEVLGQNVKILMPSPHRENHDQYLENYHETGVKKIIGKGREDQGMRKDGTTFPILLSVSDVRWDGECIYISIIRDMTNRRKLENEILEASEEERRRIGQDLHDGLGQMLTGISLISRNIASKLEENGLPGADEVGEVAELVEEADEYARSLSHSLVPVAVGEEGLQNALTQLAKRAEKLFKITCNVELKGEPKVDKESVALHLYRIAQEAINNAVKHGNASQINLLLIGRDEYLQLLVEDNGIGFPDEWRSSNNNGLGVHTMQYRAHILGGNLTIGESADGWTRVRCKVPYYQT